MIEDVPEPEEIRLPFTHGIEVELQIISRDGSWIKGEEILNVFDKLVGNAKSLLDQRIRTARVESVKRKFKQSAQTEEGERGSRIVALYESPDGESREYTLIGHDPNVTSLTWILEVATPPCTSLEELAWWVQTLVAVSYDSLPKESRAILISTGLNPAQEYLKNLSFGEHHHILGPEVTEKVKLAVYNLIRNFIPHLIALSVNSPFENKKPTDEVEADEEGRVRAPRCKRSIRLMKNTTQMGPINEFEYIPYLTKADKEGFARHVNRSFARMVDMYPFTDYGTVELRVFDTQLSVPRRIGLAIILQALALKAKRMVEAGEKIPDVGPDSLAANRASAVAAGLWGPFRPGEGSMNKAFMQTYNMMVDDDGTVSKSHRNRFLGDAVSSMLYFIRSELEELNVIENAFIQPLFVSIFGSEFVAPRTTGADFQLSVFAKSDMNMVVLMRSLSNITRECCTNWLYDPLEGTPHLPTWLCWWKGLEPEIITDEDRVFAGQEAGFTLTLRNTGPRAFIDIDVSYSIEDSERHLVDQGMLHVENIDPGEILVNNLTFLTQKQISAYNILASIGIADRQIALSSTINTYWMKASIHRRSSIQFADGRTPVYFNGEIDTNYPESTTIKCRVAVIAPAKEEILSQVETSISLEGSEGALFSHQDFPALIIPGHASAGIERCAIQIWLIDEEGDEIAVGVSKSFHVGFVKRGPQIGLEAELGSVHLPEDILLGKVFIEAGGRPIEEDMMLVLEFLTDSNRAYRILEQAATTLEEGPLNFHWRVPSIPSNESSDRAGVIRALVRQGTEDLTAAHSERFRIAQLGVKASIDSLRAPERARIGGRISGWLRVRRNTELGDPALLTMKLIFSNGEEEEVLSQPVKQSRNLSISYGPIVIPEPSELRNPKKVTLEARLSYAGIDLDRSSVEIQLSEELPEVSPGIDIVALPNFVAPDELVRPTLRVSNHSGSVLKPKLKVVLEAISETKTVLERELVLLADEEKLLPLEFRAPLGSEMSAAHLVIISEANDQVSEKRARFKIKAIEEPLFYVTFSVRNESGAEVPGLVPRLTQVLITAHIQSARENMENLFLVVRIMSRREAEKEFEVAFPDSAALENVISLKWTTPAIDVVTGYYLDALVKQGKTPLPERAIEQERRQFTVY